MLHRMTTLLSAVVVAFVAANALNAVSPAIAQAADSNAGAELEAAVAAPLGRVETASSPRSVTTELARFTMSPTPPRPAIGCSRPSGRFTLP